MTVNGAAEEPGRNDPATLPEPYLFVAPKVYTIETRKRIG